MVFSPQWPIHVDLFGRHLGLVSANIALIHEMASCALSVDRTPVHVDILARQ